MKKEIKIPVSYKKDYTSTIRLSTKTALFFEQLQFYFYKSHFYKSHFYFYQ